MKICLVFFPTREAQWFVKSCLANVSELVFFPKRIYFHTQKGVIIVAYRFSRILNINRS